MAEHPEIGLPLNPLKGLAAAKIVQEEARSQGIALKILPSGGSEEALEAVEDGKLDLAFVQGGLDALYPNVEHVATLPPELIHFLVRPSIHDALTATAAPGKRLDAPMAAN